MTYQDNDTLNKGQQNRTQSKSENKNAMTAKLLASVASGLAVGAGATYAAQFLNASSDDAVAENTAAENTASSSHAEAQAPQTASASAQATAENHAGRTEQYAPSHEQKEHVQQKQDPENHRPETPKQEEEPKVDHDNNVLKGHDVKIESMEEGTLEDGTTVRIYSGTLDGHQAAFMANGNGQVVAAIVDANDNGNVDDNEVIDLREGNVTTQYLANHQVTPAPAPSTEHEVEVVAVENDVEMGGETVDVAVVAIDEEPVMLVDRSQNGEVDLAIADRNQDGNIGEDEIQDVSSAHIPMPTADDITSDDTITACTDDGTEDYSNDADVEVYDV